MGGRSLRILVSSRKFCERLERSASVSSEARARAPASCQHPLERRKSVCGVRSLAVTAYTRHLANTLPWKLDVRVQVAAPPTVSV